MRRDEPCCVYLCNTYSNEGLTMRENKEFVLFENASLVHKCLLETLALALRSKTATITCKSKNISVCVCVILTSDS